MDLQQKTKSKMSAQQWNRRLRSNEYTERRITFGKYTGQMIKNIPMPYIKWGVANLNREWAEYFSRELRRRDKTFK